MKLIEIKTGRSINEEDQKILRDLGFCFVKKHSIFGGDVAWTVIGTVATTSIAAITKIIIELIKSNSLVELEINGLKVKGINKEIAENIIKNICKND